MLLSGTHYRIPFHSIPIYSIPINSILIQSIPFHVLPNAVIYQYFICTEGSPEDDNGENGEPNRGQEDLLMEEVKDLERHKQNIRMKKSRIIKGLGSLSKRLKEAQAMEPCSFIFLVKEECTWRFKFYGHGSLLTKFMNGEALSETPEKRKNRYHKLVEPQVTETSAELLTPNKYGFPLGPGSGKSIAEKQREELDSLTVKKANANIVTAKAQSHR